MILRQDTWKSIISEHFDIFDNNTRKTLLSLHEQDDQNMVLSSLSNKLYHHIIEKTAEIDYGGIPLSKGDITKIPHFLDIKECLSTIQLLVVEFKGDTTPVDEVLKLIENLKSSKDIWEKAYLYKSEIPIILYETMALSIVSSTSLLISTCIEYIKEPTEETFTIVFDKVGYSKSKKSLLFKNIIKFNKAYSKGEIRKVMEPTVSAITKVKESVDIVTEVSVTGVIAGIITAGLIGALITLIIPLLQELVCFFYCGRQKFSDFFEIQANILAINAESVKLDYTKNKKDREAIYKKQMKYVETFKKISNKLAVTMKTAETNSEKMIKKETIKYKVDDLEKESNIDFKNNSSSSLF